MPAVAVSACLISPGLVFSGLTALVLGAASDLDLPAALRCFNIFLAIDAHAPQEKNATNEPCRDGLCPKLPVENAEVEGKTMFAQKDKTCSRPRVVLALADSAQAALCARQCRRQGWEVHQAHSGRKARRLAATIEPAVVVLDAELAGESGWLTAAKLLLERPRQKILLTGPEHNRSHERFAAFLGAAGFVVHEETTTALAEFAGVLAPVWA
jgi:hypothetical protein